eukprot:CAMPEP_0178393008 /NCGR_PEP_ID=MMETSP0689_2-20121128/11968_1 /TAXON_ID=160604 /ORGANISM="Amphidinium massartii, Strain CS-259" /LENGTH=1116 /DNA_ID=CAMNT_0020013591 /DNA_START=121 /DNA_END=3468 /DNA_ORIENTATION=-
MKPSESVNQSNVSVELDYTDTWPAVEVTVAINEMHRFDMQELVFDADFTVYLDWTDSKLRRGVHYEYNTEHGKFELHPSLQSLKSDLRFFNPVVEIENGKLTPESDSDTLPSIFNEITVDGQDVPWLTKRFEFIGTLACRHVNAQFFPFDVENLSIRLAICDMQGVTSLGHPRTVSLREPELRKRWRHSQMRRQKVGSRAKWAIAHPEHEAMSHMWKIRDDAETTGEASFLVGEMRVLAFGGAPTAAGHSYILTVCLRRLWYPRYVFEFVIQNLQVLTALFSIFVPFTEDLLANRMGITLTVLLTLVSSMSSRPALIEMVPYPTLWDNYGQVVVFCVCVVGLGNLLVFVQCWGLFRQAGFPDDPDTEFYFDPDLELEIHKLGVSGPLSQNVGLCRKTNAFGMTNLRLTNMDAIILYLQLSFQVWIIGHFLLKAEMHRVSTLLMLKHRIDSPDHSPGKYSKLVLCGRDGFQFVERLNTDECAAFVSMMWSPHVFLWIWGKCRRMRDNLRRVVVRDDSDTFHATRAREMLEAATASLKEEDKKLPKISRFHVKLSPFDYFRVIDVGSGEMGFYCYWLDSATRCVCAEGVNDKLKYVKNMTFVDQFLYGTGGVDSLVEEIVTRFRLHRLMSGTDSFNDAGPRRAGTADEVSMPGVPLLGEDGIAGGDPSMPGSPARRDEGDVENPAMAPTTTGFGEGLVETVGSLLGAAFSLRHHADHHHDQPPPSRDGGRSRRKRKILLCLTGANRQMLSDDAQGRKELADYLRLVNDRLAEFNVECIAYSPEDVDEAMYELWATEWVIQHGDLSLDGIRQHIFTPAHRILKGIPGTDRAEWEEVSRCYADLQAEVELKAAYIEASSDEGSPPSRTARNMLGVPASVPIAAFYDAFNQSDVLLRSLLRARVFGGTISAGSGSSQVTLRSSANLDSSQVSSLPLGNRTPLVSMKLGLSNDAWTCLSPKLPRTRSKAIHLLTESGDGHRRTIVDETRPAWSEDGPVDATLLQQWRDLVLICAEERDIPRERRGMFVGISAVFYAAKLANCAEMVLDRDTFLNRLDRKMGELLAAGGKDGRGLANIVLVHSLVETVLHKTALIVCKRNWTVGEGTALRTEFVATWTLGLYL